VTSTRIRILPETLLRDLVQIRSQSVTSSNQETL